jgi:hypothetical protein
MEPWRHPAPSSFQIDARWNHSQRGAGRKTAYIML